MNGTCFLNTDFKVTLKNRKPITSPGTVSHFFLFCFVIRTDVCIFDVLQIADGIKPTLTELEKFEEQPEEMEISRILLFKILEN